MFLAKMSLSKISYVLTAVESPGVAKLPKMFLSYVQTAVETPVAKVVKMFLLSKMIIPKAAYVESAVKTSVAAAAVTVLCRLLVTC